MLQKESRRHATMERRKKTRNSSAIPRLSVLLKLLMFCYSYDNHKKRYLGIIFLKRRIMSVCCWKAIGLTWNDRDWSFYSITVDAWQFIDVRDVSIGVTLLKLMNGDFSESFYQIRCENGSTSSAISVISTSVFTFLKSTGQKDNKPIKCDDSTKFWNLTFSEFVPKSSRTGI